MEKAQPAEKKISEGMQRHHDHYVQAEKAGPLSREDQEQFNLAKEREAAGEVKPLTQTEPVRKLSSRDLIGRDSME